MRLCYDEDMDSYLEYLGKINQDAAQRWLMRWWKLYMGYLSFTNLQMPVAIFANNTFDRIDIL